MQRPVTAIDLEALKTPEFDQSPYSQDEIIWLYPQMLRSLGVASSLVDGPKFKHFMQGVKSSYHANPFHCFEHGFQVAQMMFALLIQNELVQVFDTLELLSLMLAALWYFSLPFSLPRTV